MSAAVHPAVPSEQERSELILAYLPRVRLIAARVRGKLSSAVALEDLVSVGVLGLIHAIDRFDASQNVKLTTYADYRIRGSMLDSIRDLAGVPVHKRMKMKRIHRAAAAAAQRLHASPDDEQIAAELGIPVQEYHEWLSEVRPCSVCSLEGTLMVGPHTVKLADVLADDKGQEPDQVLERRQLRQLVDRALSGLPPAQHRVMDLYFREGLRIHEIAEILGLHSSRVWQMKDKAIRRVRDYLRTHWNGAKERKPAGRVQP
jgi:RNA polymerase sigma factor for flagellar operon FliA